MTQQICKTQFYKCYFSWENNDDEDCTALDQEKPLTGCVWLGCVHMITNGKRCTRGNLCLVPKTFDTSEV